MFSDFHTAWVKIRAQKWSKSLLVMHIFKHRKKTKKVHNVCHLTMKIYIFICLCTFFINKVVLVSISNKTFLTWNIRRLPEWPYVNQMSLSCKRMDGCLLTDHVWPIRKLQVSYLILPFPTQGGRLNFPLSAAFLMSLKNLLQLLHAILVL